MIGPVYLLSTLPHLDGTFSWAAGGAVDEQRAGAAHVPSETRFVELCRGTLSEADARAVQTALEQPNASDKVFVREAGQYLQGLMVAVAKHRHAALGRSGAYINTADAGAASGAVFGDAAAIVARAAAAANPLEREIELTKALWAFLDDRDAQYFQSVENVIIYGYKLKLFHKILAFRREEGNKNWTALVEQLAEKAGFSKDAVDARNAMAGAQS